MIDNDLYARQFAFGFADNLKIFPNRSARLGPDGEGAWGGLCRHDAIKSHTRCICNMKTDQAGVNILRFLIITIGGGAACSVVRSPG